MKKQKNTILSTCVQAQQNGGRDLALRVEASFCFDFLLLFDQAKSIMKKNICPPGKRAKLIPLPNQLKRSPVKRSVVIFLKKILIKPS
jgi:hypothetical protein